MKLSTAFQGYTLDRTADGYSPNTIAVYAWAINILTNFLDDPHIETITLSDLRAFFTYLRTQYTPNRPDGDTSPLSGSSLENAWKAIRSLFTWANQELDIPRPDNQLPRPRYTSAQIKPFTQSEITALLKATSSTATAQTNGRKPFRMSRPTARRDRAIVLTLLDTGLRVSELSRLQIQHLDLKTGELTIIPHGSGQKTKARLVYLGKAARSAVWKYLAHKSAHAAEPAPTDPLFTTLENTILDRNAIRHIITGLAKRAGIDHAHPHKFRHTFAIQYLRNGGDIFTLQRILGHASLEMVRKYLTLADADAQSAHTLASPVDRWNL